MARIKFKADAYSDYPAQVTKAAAYLDRVLPDWWDHINRAQLDLSDGRSCIGGQLASSHPRWAHTERTSYYQALDELDIDGVPLVWCSNNYGIREAWVDEITQRIAARFSNNESEKPAAPAESARVTVLAGNSVYEVDRSFDGLMRLLSHLDVDLKEREVTKL